MDGKTNQDTNMQTTTDKLLKKIQEQTNALISNKYLFEPNNKETRLRIRKSIRETVKSMYHGKFRVDCNATNNEEIIQDLHMCCYRIRFYDIDRELNSSIGGHP